MRRPELCRGAMTASSAALGAKTSLHGLHVALGAKMVPFGGYDMPVQYPTGILAEHLHTRAQAGLFDVGHMGQVRLRGADAIKALERLVPGDIAALAPGQMRYTQFTNDQGGILDDFMVTRFGDHLFIVFNAGCKADDVAHLKSRMPASVGIEHLEDRGLIALQGPKAAEVMRRLSPAAAALSFMTAAACLVGDEKCLVSRSGYTGEDGFEISVEGARAEALARRLLDMADVKPIGLGARDSLRLEAGLCLYGHDIDKTTTPIEAGLAWSISKRRRAEGGFPGEARIRREIAEGPARRLVGIRPDGKAPAREGTDIVDQSGNVVGKVTSGGFGPTVGGPIAMGYVPKSLAQPETRLGLIVRGKTLDAKVARLPFVEKRYAR